MLLVIDVGNTNMEFGLYRGAELIGSFRLMTDANRTSDELGLWLCQYFQRFGVSLDQLEDVVIGSVVPQIMHTLSNAVKKYLGKEPLVIDEDVLEAGVIECPNCHSQFAVSDECDCDEDGCDCGCGHDHDEE